MSNKSIGLSEALHDYLIAHSTMEPEILRELRAKTALMSEHNMQIAPEQGQFMAMLAGLMGVKRYLEIGTFTGYSALVIAMALPLDGEVVTLDNNPDFTKTAQAYWRKSGFDERIRLHLAPAMDSLEKLIKEGGAGSFDMAFIDADKENYQGYFEHCLTLLRRGGLILIDNVLWDGAVLDASDNKSSTVAIRAFNEWLKNDGRVEIAMIPVGDGLTLARKLSENPRQ